MTTFKHTIEVFNKIASRVKSTEGNLVDYTVTEKQFEWLAKTYIREAKGWDTRFGVTLTDDEGNKYSFSYHNSNFNVPY